MSPCIEFTGTIHKVTGYGVISVGSRHGMPAHRYHYELANGPIPKGMVIMHLCDNRKCINPEHLKVGTQSENMLDCVAKGRNHDQRGEKSHRAKLTTAEVVEIKRLLPSLDNNQLGERYGVNRKTICDIRSGKTWRHVNG